MSDSEIYDVSYQLDELACHFLDALPAGATLRPAANDKMIDELIGRNELIDELESSLLPAIKDHISSLLLALDLQHSGTQPNVPDLDLILEIVPKFHETLTKTTCSVESVSAPFEGVCTNERNLGRCKDFKCRLLRSAVAYIIRLNLCPLFSRCIDVIQTCQLSSKHPENLEYRARRSKWIKETRKIADATISHLDSTIETSKKTDLAILQDNFWCELSVNIALEDLTKLVDPRIDVKHEGVSIDELNIIKTRRGHIVEIARLTIPIVKLTRIFLVKIRNSAPKKPSFILDPEIDSNSLQLLSEAPNTISGRLGNLASFLTVIYKEDWGFDLNRNLYSNSLRELPLLLDSILLILCRYLIPVPTAVDDHSPSQSDFKVWFLDLQSLYLKATDRLLNAFQCSCHPCVE